MERNPIIKREPITRVPLSWDDIREHITFDDNTKWYDIWKFEGIYQINLSGCIKKVSTGEYLKLYSTKNGYNVVLRHPDGDGSSLCCNLIDVWSSTFLGDNALNKYSYMDNIK